LSIENIDFFIFICLTYFFRKNNYEHLKYHFICDTINILNAVFQYIQHLNYNEKGGYNYAEY